MYNAAQRTYYKEDDILKDFFEKTSFLAGKAGNFSKVPLRTVQSWVEKGLLVPAISDTKGTGDKRLFNIWNCIEIGIIKTLADGRVSIKLIKEIMDFLRVEFNVPLSFQIPVPINNPLKSMVEADKAILFNWVNR